jgi:hypothetical protein
MRKLHVLFLLLGTLTAVTVKSSPPTTDSQDEQELRQIEVPPPKVSSQMMYP